MTDETTRLRPPADTELVVASESKRAFALDESKEGETTAAVEAPRLAPADSPPPIHRDLLGLHGIGGPEATPVEGNAAPAVSATGGLVASGIPSPSRDSGLVDAILAGRTIDPANVLRSLTDLGLDPDMAGSLSKAAGDSPEVSFGVHIGHDGRPTVSMTITNTQNGGTSVVDIHIDEQGIPVVDNVMTYSPPPLEEAEEEAWAPYPGTPSAPPLVDADTGEPVGGDAPASDEDEWANPFAPADEEQPPERPPSKLTEEDEKSEEDDTGEEPANEDTDEEGYQPADGGGSGTWSEDPRIAAIVGAMGAGGIVQVDHGPIDPPDPIPGEDQGGELGPIDPNRDPSIDPIAYWGPDGEGSGQVSGSGGAPPEPAPIDPPEPIPGTEAAGLGSTIDAGGDVDPIGWGGGEFGFGGPSEGLFAPAGSAIAAGEGSFETSHPTASSGDAADVETDSGPPVAVNEGVALTDTGDVAVIGEPVVLGPVEDPGTTAPEPDLPVEPMSEEPGLEG